MCVRVYSVTLYMSTDRVEKETRLLELNKYLETHTHTHTLVCIDSLNACGCLSFLWYIWVVLFLLFFFSIMSRDEIEEGVVH